MFLSLLQIEFVREWLFYTGVANPFCRILDSLPVLKKLPYHEYLFYVCKEKLFILRVANH